MADVRPLAALASLFALAACGGGGGGTPPPPPPATSTSATLSVTLAGGASPGIDHLWVTITGVALNADPAKVFGDGDPSWVVLTLPTTITVDLAAPELSRGQSIALLKQTVSALGSYQQLRLIVAPSDSTNALVASARNAGLTWNDQVQYTDSSGQHSVPLEIPDTQSGIRTRTAFTLSADTSTPVAIEWNAHSSLVRRASGSGSDRFTLRDELQLYNQQLLTALGDDLLQIGGSIFDSISGQFDTSLFCTGSDRSNCIHDVVASATSLSADSRFHREVRSVNVGADGAFLLYPLPSDAAYDVVIHGGNMQTIVVRNVFVDPTGLLQPFPTSLGTVATPIVPVLDTSGTRVAVPNALTPGASRVLFGFTIPGSGTASGSGDLPYVLETDAADPATGLVAGTIALPGGAVHDALFDPKTNGLGVPPTFSTVTPAEGLGGWTVWSEGTLADGASATTRLAPGAATVAVANPQRLAGFGAGTLNVTLAGTPTNGADRAELIVSNDGGTVAVADVSATLAAHGDPVAIAVPSGSASGAPAAAVYGVALRTWQAGAETASVRWVRAPAPTSLVGTNTASVALTLP